MTSPPLVSDAFSLSGQPLDRLRQALKIAGHKARVAQNSGYGRHVEDALVELEEVLGRHLARIEDAVSDDQAEAEEYGEPARERRSWFPRYEAV